MSIEDELREALSAEAAEASPASDAWARLSAAAAEAKRRQRRMWLGGGVVAVAAALMIALAATALLDDSGRRRVTTVDRPPETVPSTVPDRPAVSTETTQPPSALPDTVIAYSSRGRVVEISTVTGEAVRTIADTKYDGSTYPVIGHVDVSPDGKTVYYDSTDGVWQVARAGGTPKRLGDGYMPVLSPDGKTLAYARPEMGSVLVLRDLTTGVERVLRPAQDEGPLGIYSMSWAPGGRSLVMYAGWEDSNYTMRIDTVTATQLKGPYVDHPKDVERGSYLRNPMHLSATSYLAVHECCMKDDADGMLELDRQSSRLAMAAFDGRYEGAKVDLGKRNVTHLHVDRTGRHAAYVLDTNELFGWSTSGPTPPRKLGTGFVSAVFPPR